MSSLSTWINWIKGLWDTQSRPHSHDGGESGQSGELIKDNTSGQEPTAVETPTNDLTSIAVGDIEQQFHSIKLVGQTDLLKIPKHQHLADDYKDGAAAGSQKGQELKSYQDELEQEHNRANNFRRQLEAMTNEKELLSAKLVQLQRDNDAAQLTITQKGEEVNCYQKNQEKLQAQLIQLTEWQSKHETVLMDLSQKEEKLKSCQEELKQRHKSADNFQSQLKAMTNKKESLSVQLEQLQTDNDAAQVTIAQKDEEVNKSQEKLQSQLKQLTEEQNKHEAVLKDLSQKEQELKSCQEELKQCHKSANNVQSQLEAMTNEKELLSVQLAQLHRNNDAAQLTIRKKDEELKCYQNKADNFQSQLKAMTNEKESLSVQLEQLQTDTQIAIAQKDEEVNKSQEKLQAQLKQLTEEQNKYEAVLKDLSQKEQELKSYQEELKQCHKSADNFQSQFKAMTNEKELLSVQLEQLQTDTQIAIAQKDEEVNKSQEDLQAQLKQLTEEQNKYEAVLKDLSQKEQELKSCQEELKQCHKSANNFQSQLEAMTNEKELLSVQLAQLHRNNDAAQLTIRKKDEELKCYQNNLDKPQAQLIEWKNKYEAVFKDLSQKEEELKSCQEELKQCHKKLLEMEEVSFQLTNSFTTADSRSPLILSQEYRNIQHNCRPAASRAHRKTYNGCDSVPFEKHTMVAYKEAKHQVLTALQNHIERSLFIMQKEDECASQIPKCVKLMLNKLYTDHSLTKDPVEAIVEVLCKEYRDHVDRKDADIPPQVHEYYEKLADFTWTTVTKAIPMVLSTDKDQYDNEIHELIDDDETDEAVSSAKFTYIYPTLFTSNSWPREVALKGRIKFVDM
ncbi:interaptin-like isoform X2 [Dysidea avara]|uniref:interaptin-like isoform X2 n=1 Tax=Dysidea avara TaxID=196820 RepID=UPI0033283DC6